MPDLPIIISIVEILMLIVAFSTGISVATLIGNSKNDFLGDCILYADVNYTTPTNFVVIPGSLGKCSYCIGLQSVILIAAFIYAAYRTLVLITNKFDLAMLRFICVPIFTLFTFMVLIQAFIVSMGLRHFCRGLKSEPSFANKHCKRFQTAEWRLYKGSQFYDTLNMAEGASWVSFISWLVLLVLGVFSAYKYRQYTKMTSSIVDKK